MSSAILLVHIWLTHQQFTITRGHLERFQFGTLVFLDLVIHRCYGSIHLSLLTKSNPRRSNNIKSWLSWVTKAEHYWQSTLTMTVAYCKLSNPLKRYVTTTNIGATYLNLHFGKIFLIRLNLFDFFASFIDLPIWRHTWYSRNSRHTRPSRSWRGKGRTRRTGP